MAKKSSGGFQTDPAEALAKWLGQRYDAQHAYVGLINQRENQLLACSEATGPHSEKYLQAARDMDSAEREDERIRVVIGRPLNRWNLPIWVLVASAWHSPSSKRR